METFIMRSNIRKLCYKFAFLALICIFPECTKSGSSDNAIVSLVAGGFQSPFISSVSPQRGSPAQSSTTLSYAATEVTITGRGFVATLTDNTVTFGGTTATVTYASNTEIKTTVPSGAVSGILSVVNKGGACNSIDGKSGIYCATSNFYVDCYAPYKNVYGEETVIDSGTSKTVNFSSAGTKAFRSDLFAGTNTILVSCINMITGVTLKYFSNSCGITETTSYLDAISVQVNSAAYTIQYFITAVSGDCTIRIN